MRLDAVGREIIQSAACARFLHDTALGAEEEMLVDLNRHIARACLAWAEEHGVGSEQIEREIKATVERSRAGRHG